MNLRSVFALKSELLIQMFSETSINPPCLRRRWRACRWTSRCSGPPTRSRTPSSALSTASRPSTAARTWTASRSCPPHFVAFSFAYLTLLIFICHRLFFCISITLLISINALSPCLFPSSFVSIPELSPYLKVALTRTVNALGRKLKLMKEEQPNLSGDHIREGLGAIVSVKARRLFAFAHDLFTELKLMEEEQPNVSGDHTRGGLPFTT